MFTARVTNGKKRERVFARTDFFEQLLALRVEKLETVAADTQPEETLSIFDGPKQRTLLDKNAVPSTVVIRAPDIGLVEGINIQMLMSWKYNAAIFVELCPGTINYVRDACLWQIGNATIKRPRQQKKTDNGTRDASDSEYAEEEEEESGMEEDIDIEEEGIDIKESPPSLI